MVIRFDGNIYIKYDNHQGKNDLKPVHSNLQR